MLSRLLRRTDVVDGHWVLRHDVPHSQKSTDSHCVKGAFVDNVVKVESCEIEKNVACVRFDTRDGVLASNRRNREKFT